MGKREKKLQEALDQIAAMQVTIAGTVMTMSKHLESMAASANLIADWCAREQASKNVQIFQNYMQENWKDNLVEAAGEPAFQELGYEMEGVSKDHIVGNASHDVSVKPYRPIGGYDGTRLSKLTCSCGWHTTVATHSFKEIAERHVKEGK
jgi:hypothetical protein